MKFNIYSRKSKFTGKGESIENQIELCKNYILRDFPDAKESDIIIFEDEGFSAKNLNRPQYQEMIKYQQINKVDFVVVYRLDRISRNVSDFSNLLEDFKSRNVGFISINEKFDTSTPMGRAMITIAAIFAQLERETIAERVRDNMMMLARTGRWLGGNPPLGYVSEKVEHIKLDDKVHSYCKLKIDPDGSELVTLIFQKFLEFQSLTAVENYLIKFGIQKDGKYIRIRTIKNILSHPVYCIADKQSYEYLQELKCQLYCELNECDGKHGYSTYNRTTTSNTSKNKQIPTDKSEWIIAVGKHNGLISGDDWIKVNNILGTLQPTGYNRKIHNSISLLSGLVRCGLCGSAMCPKPVTYYNGTDKEGTFDYLCELKARSTKHKCNCSNIHGNEFDTMICNELFKYQDENSLIGKQFIFLKENKYQQNSTCQNNIVKLRKVLAEKECSIHNLVVSMMKLTSDVSIGYVQQEIDNLDVDIKNLKSEISELERIEDFNLIVNQQFDTMKGSIQMLSERFITMSVVEKRELIKQIVDKIVWDGKGNANIFIKGVQ